MHYALSRSCSTFILSPGWIQVGCPISLGTSSNFAIMPVPRKHVPLLSPETSQVSALIQACMFLLNKSLYASLCVCLLICYIAGKLMLSCMVSYWNFGTDVPSVFLDMHSLVDSPFAGLPFTTSPLCIAGHL